MTAFTNGVWSTSDCVSNKNVASPLVEGKTTLKTFIHIISDIAIVYTVKVWDGYKNARNKINV